jgi:hypothetical protein
LAVTVLCTRVRRTASLFGPDPRSVNFRVNEVVDDSDELALTEVLTNCTL